MISIFKKLFDNEYKELKRFNEIATKIDALDEEYSKLTDKKLAAKTDEFKKRLADGEDIEDILVEAFATIREAAYRIIGEKAYFCQLVGGLAIHYGNIAEMKTGEGKTLTTIFPAYVNALTGLGVHVVTVNEYLTTRNAEWMGPVFNFLGLTVGINLRDLSPKEKQEVYNCDIMYTTNNELGFDYLRDNMVVRAEDRVGRKLNYCIIDEVDSVLIDEARTPLIISGGVMQNVNLFEQADMFAKSLTENEDYIKDEKTRSISLTDEGSHKCERIFKIDNLYDINNTALVHHINLALKANYFMRKDVDYVVQDGEIVIVDQFTGRLMKGRAYSEGLHQAIEAKEHVKINQETKTLATITFQNLFRMYNKLSGMTGTAKTEEEEFRNIYNMYVITIPTNKPVIREDATDLLYPGKEGKYNAIVRVVEERHKLGQPILIGTIAIETSELISKMLTKKRIKHEVLNAKNHAREAEIIAHAGEIGAVTIATNMAGRGTDIKLGPGVKELGGLCVIGTERHESRRIDNQLRGRAGRQGDPGFSQFFVSFEDDLLIRFGSEKYKQMMANIGFTGDQAIRNSMFAKTVETAQKRVEGNNFDIRKHLLSYDDVMNNQRAIIYERRNEILDNESIHEKVLGGFKDYITNLVMSHLIENKNLQDNDYDEILEASNENLLKRYRLNLSEIKGKQSDEVIDIIYEKVLKDYEEKLKEVPIEIVNEFEKAISLRVIDHNWMEHISTMSHLREGVGLRGYANVNPLQAYTSEGYELFDNMLNKINSEISIYLLKSEIRQNTERKEVVKKVITNDGKETVKKSKKSSKVGRNDP
ncbi:MAG: preprotein translocase subunit SecA, partial [Erysipelotrichaceae bacterium]|nr:preprotein translocase subunit SecA [Erysipelotrichaceae bacterium]